MSEKFLRCFFGEFCEAQAVQYIANIVKTQLRSSIRTQTMTVAAKQILLVEYQIVWKIFYEVQQLPEGVGLLVQSIPVDQARGVHL